VSVLGLFVLRGLLVTLAVRQPFVITNGPSSSRVAMNVLRRVLRTVIGVGARAPTPDPELKRFRMATKSGAAQHQFPCTTRSQEGHWKKRG
tara:strand:- start:102 stop:374 length:273 start_codon:yes stop_codon:yes gene_type:complete